MLLNVLKGAYPSLQQISKDHLIAASANCERGMCLVEKTTDGTTYWKVADATDATDPKAVVHFSLHGAYKGVEDYQTRMAGRAEKGLDKVSALSCTMPMEIETDMFDDADTIAVGDYMTVGAGGKLKKATYGTANVYLQVTKAPYYRWSNNGEATESGGFRQGTSVKVIAGRTLFVPKAA